MGHGDDMFKVAGVGEHTVNDSRSPAFYAATELAARERWLLQEHSGTTEENYYHIGAFEAANEIAPIADLHWSLTHVHEIDSEILDRLIGLHRKWIAIEFGLGVAADREGRRTDATSCQPLHE